MKQNLGRVGRFAGLKAVGLIFAVVIAVYLTVVIANMGGALDQARIGQIRFQVSTAVYMDPANQGVPPEQLQEMIEDAVQRQVVALGLDRPFIERSFRYLGNAITLNLGRSEFIVSDSASRQVRTILTDRIPPTLLLIATAELILFFLALFAALFLSRRYGSILDRLTIGLAPTSAAPAWFYGLFLILIFAGSLRILPWGGMVEAPAPESTGQYALSVLRHLVLPVAAVLIGAVFSSIYSWRTFFLIYSSEDYVELARAKGLSSQAIERRYILRPSLPPIITSFMLMIITMWMGAILLETIFQWPGLGRLFYQAMTVNDTPVVVGVIVIYGYLLAASVFLLEFLYAVLDPRVRVGGKT